LRRHTATQHGSWQGSTPTTAGAIYVTVGDGYQEFRRPAPRIASAIRSAVGDASSVMNVVAGTGSHDPDDRELIAIEPSAVRSPRARRRRSGNPGGRSGATANPGAVACAAYLLATNRAARSAAPTEALVEVASSKSLQKGRLPCIRCAAHSRQAKSTTCLS
jgi:hypothetical protein